MRTPASMHGSGDHDISRALRASACLAPNPLQDAGMLPTLNVGLIQGRITHVVPDGSCSDRPPISGEHPATVETECAR